jgi:hypothetical protein
MKVAIPGMSRILRPNIEVPELPGPVINGRRMTHLGSSMDDFENPDNKGP